MKKGGRTFYGCSNYKDESLKCDFKLWAKPVLQPCPDCGAEFMTRGGSKTKPMLVCVTEGCGHKEALPIEDDVGAEQLAAGP
jgi:DNA topoisomerase-1